MGGEEVNLEELRQEEEEDEESCKKEKHEEIMKFRMHQYNENPNMKITGEDIKLVMNCDHCGPCVTDQVRQDCGDWDKVCVS
jgi:ferredoxin